MNIVGNPQWRDAWSGILFVVNLCGLFIAPYVVFKYSSSTSTLGDYFMTTLKIVIVNTPNHLVFGGILVLLLFFLPDMMMHISALVVGYMAIRPFLITLAHLVVKPDVLTLAHQVSESISVLLAILLVICLHRRLVESSRIVRAEKHLIRRIPILWSWVGTMLAGLLLIILIPSPMENSTLALYVCIHQGLGLLWLVLVVASVGQSLVASQAIVELDGGQTKGVLMLTAKRSLTTSFGSLCIAAVVGPVKLLMGKPDSHAYTKMALANMSYSEASADAPHSQLAKDQVISFLALAFASSFIPGVLLSAFFLSAADAGMYDWIAYPSTVFGPLLVVKMWVEGTLGAILLKWEHNEAYMLQMFPQIAPIEKHSEGNFEPRQRV